MGLAASSGTNALLERRTLDGLAVNDDGDELANRCLELKLGYGFAAFGNRFTSTPGAALGWSDSERETILALASCRSAALRARVRAGRRGRTARRCRSSGTPVRRDDDCALVNASPTSNRPAVHDEAHERRRHP